MKKIKLGILLLTVAFLTIIVAGLVWWKSVNSPISSDGGKVRFVIPKGKGAAQIGAMLEEEGLIKSALAFKMYVQIFDKQTSINAGEFSLSPTMNLSEIISTLEKGPTELWVTIPEGLRREEVVEKVIIALEMDATQADSFRDEFLKYTVDKEGYLFPDTYLFAKDTTAKKVVDVMLSNFQRRFTDKYPGNYPKGLTQKQVVILASIIEKETKEDEERPVVAGIYFNRMSIGQALQADATVQYPLGTIRCEGKVDCDWWVPPRISDYEIDSPYNTYAHNSLPPSPIANPGLKSLEAVIESKESPYFYYIHAGGDIYYARDLDEHNENVAKYLR